MDLYGLAFHHFLFCATMRYGNITILGAHKLALSYRDKIARAKAAGKIDFQNLLCVPNNPEEAILDIVFNKPIHNDDVLVPDHTAKHVFLQAMMKLVDQKFPHLKAELSPFDCRGVWENSL